MIAARDGHVALRSRAGTGPSTHHGPASHEAGCKEPLPPPPPARCDKLFVRIDRALAWIDGWLGRWIPVELNPLAHAGAAANAALIIAVASGVLMLLWYSPSVQFAHSSLAALEGRTLGGTVRAVHRYSSDLAMLLLIMHAGRTFFARKFAGARWLPWVSGILMLALVWLIGWTGYWLVWDQPAQQVAVTSMQLVDSVPIFGEPMGRLYVADRTVPSLLFFVVFFLHMLLPLLIAVGLAVHLVRVSRVRLMPPRALSLALLAGLVLAALIVPAPLDPPARMAEKAAAFTVDAWYLAPLAFALRFQHAGLWIALFGGTLLGALVPWLLGRRRPREAFQATVNVSRCHACTQCAQDCPFDAITMAPRTDGKKFPSQAQVDPARCIGCGVCAGSCDSEGIVLPWFDTHREEERIASACAAAIAQGGPRWVALVCDEIDGGPGRARHECWAGLLHGYQIHGVPTASWVRPRLVERLIASGVNGVLVVRNSSAESWSRDGRRWVAERLSARRAPVFRPECAPDGAWFVVDFDPSRPEALMTSAIQFRRRGESRVERRKPRAQTAVFASAVLAAGICAAAVAPSHLRVQSPASADPEFVFSFKALGEMQEAAPLDAAAEAAKPVHMRGRPTEKPHRADVIVRLTIDGVAEERAFPAKGLSHDGPSIGEWRRAWSRGDHRVRIEILNTAAGSVPTWENVLTGTDRRLNVVAYDPTAGFVVE